MVVIPNGFDSSRFFASPSHRASVREELSLPDDAQVVAMIARFHPDKDHRNFLAAASLVAQADPDVVFVLAGESITWSNELLGAWIDEHRLRSRMRLLSLRTDIQRVLAAVDLLVSSSSSEGLPLVIGEAMLCGVPCAATDCGDSREIIGPTGRVVPPRDPTALARAILDLLAVPPSERSTLGTAARERIMANYDIRVVARRYVALYAEVAGRNDV
jgi:glycosyltransferase involved in cell wall biosynthesis